VAQGVAEYERALVLNRNLAAAHALIGEANHVEKAFRHSPRDNFAFNWLLIIGHAKLQLKADAEAVSWFRRSIEASRNYPMAHFLIAAALALLGSLDEARAAAKAGLALDPNFTLRRYRDGATSDNPTYLAARERIYHGMRMAGIPEGMMSPLGHEL
jgi:tetratricopeptide (TPR) repeat protein